MFVHAYTYVVASYKTIHIFCFFFRLFWQIRIFQDLAHFMYFFRLIRIKLFLMTSYFSCHISSHVPFSLVIFNNLLSVLIILIQIYIFFNFFKNQGFLSCVFICFFIILFLFSIILEGVLCSLLLLTLF